MRALVIVIAWMVYMGLGNRVPEIPFMGNLGLTLSFIWLAAIDYVEVAKDE